VIYSDVLAQFNDITRDVNRYHFSQGQVDRFANRALDDLCSRARYKDTEESVNGVSGTAVYAVTSDGYDVFRVEYDDERLVPITRNSLRTNGSDWASRTGKPRFYYLDENYSSQSYLSVGLWETPSANLTSGLRIWFHSVPTTAVGTTAGGLAADVDVPDWAAGAVLFYMLYLAYTADTKIQSFEAAAIYKMMYEDIADRLVLRSRDKSPKKWVSGSSSGPSLNVLNRLPERIPSP
jgi:hypothetical protein